MPTQTFWNLSLEKREKLVTAAKKEFARVVLPEASINKIIQDAQIPRGSFYMYFKNKEELYFYILLEYRNRAISRILELLEENQGDVIATFAVLYEDIIEYCSQKSQAQYFKNVFLNMNLYMEKKVLFPSLKEDQRPRTQPALQNAINTDLLSEEAKEHLEDVLGMLFQTMTHNVVPVLLFDMSYETAKQLI